jgi:shikimate dehydrogenase
MFNAVFEKQAGLDGTVNRYIRLAAATPEEAIYLFRQLKLKGMNVTAPFKDDIRPLLDMVDAAAERIGGVNTIVWENKGLMGYNTDFTGVVESLKQAGIPVEGKQYLVLGAGGAGRAAAYGLTREGAKVVILNRTYAKAVEAANTLSANIDFIPEPWLPPGLVVFDANYKRSVLSQRAEKRGCTVIKGEQWLLNQAVPAFYHFTRTLANEDDIQTMKQALLAPAAEKPVKIALVGFMGSGKTAIGRILAHRSRLPFIDTDTLIEEREDRSIPQIFRESGETYFRNLEKEVLKEALENPEPAVIACGGGVVLAEENNALLKRHALVVWLYSSVAATLNRLEPGSRPLLDCDDPEAEAKKLLARRLSHYASVSDMVVNSEKPGLTVAENIYEEIRKAFRH